MYFNESNLYKQMFISLFFPTTTVQLNSINASANAVETTLKCTCLGTHWLITITFSHKQQ